MTTPVPVVDLFSGPGGLAEGFSSFHERDAGPQYNIALSVEKDDAAHRTLRLRAFLRRFGSSYPRQYYDFLNGKTDREPNWAQLYPHRWSKTCDETRCMELGQKSTSDFLQKRIEQLRSEHGGRTVLLGGPPCQSYSVVGRVRNAGNDWYNPDYDDRQSLYREYIRVLKQLRPAVAVLENVKGMLSARHGGQRIFPDVMRELQHGDQSEGYRLFALAPRAGACCWGEGALPADFLVRTEDHGVPQTRHRVFVVCVRRDIARMLPKHLVPQLHRRNKAVPLRDIIGAMPTLRSRLSRGDAADTWQVAVRRACKLVESNKPSMTPEEENRFLRSVKLARATANGVAPPFAEASGGTALPSSCPRELRDWIVDDNVGTLPNNETRAHIPDDLARYLYSVAFGHAFGRSPKTCDFPDALTPPHASWHTGHFADRYRVQLPDGPSTTVMSHLSKDGHSFIHPDPGQIRSLTVREAARLQTFPDNYFFHGTRTQQYVQVGNAVPPFLARQIATLIWAVIDHHDRAEARPDRPVSVLPIRPAERERPKLPIGAMGER